MEKGGTLEADKCRGLRKTIREGWEGVGRKGVSEGGGIMLEKKGET